jgi:hypothetical protein
MPTPTYTPLATVTLGSSASSVTFSSIPATYRDLVLVIQATNTSTGNSRLQLNGDTGNNYNQVRMFGAGGSPGSDSASNIESLDMSSMSTSTGYQAVIQIMDYSATDKHKTILSRTQESGITAVLANAGRYASTSAVTSIRMFTSANSYATGSTFALYGIAS